MNFGNRSTRMTLKARLALALILGSLALSTAHAEDIDIFSGNTTNAIPVNVLIIIDNSSNWSATLNNSSSCTAAGYSSTKFGAEMCALNNVIAGMPSNMRVGLMMFTENGNAGAYVRFAVRSMTSQNKTAFRSLINGMVMNGTGTDNAGSSQPYAKTMMEAFKYFGGFTDQAHATMDTAGTPTDATHFGPLAFAGGYLNNAYRRDYPNNNSPSNRAAPYYNADSNNAFQGSNANQSDTYTSPIDNACEKNFIIFISNGNPSTGGDSGTNPARDTQILTNLNVQQTCIPNCTSELHPSKMDEMAKFLYTTDVSPLPGQQRVQTYTIGVYAPQSSGLPSNSDQQMLNLMQSAASVGGGKFCAATSADAVLACVGNAVNEVQAANSVFVSASLPVSVNTQGTYLNQVYMGMFQPDANASPKWIGNLKQYKIDMDSLGNLFLADSVDVAAVNPSTGFVSPNAKSFWSAASTFWTGYQLGTPVSSSDFPDGDVILKGGAAEQVRTTYAADQSTRRMFTCPSGGCSAGAALSYAFNNTNINGSAMQSTFGASSATDLANLVNWIRGQDDYLATPCAVGSSTCSTWSSAESGPGWPTTIRPTVHGDVLHSRPVVLNYANGPYLFYAGNDGVLRGIKGGRAATDGAEQWSFVAPEFYGKFNRLRTQSPLLVLPTVLGANSAKDYFFDGPVGSYQNGSTAWIFVTARRGGRVMYAFDVSDPANPKFMWKKSNADLPELGQTWAEPKVFMVRASTDPVMMFGAGYDTAEDQTPAGSLTMGRGVYVLNARTGALIKFFQSSTNGTGSIANDIPSDLAVIDRDFDGLADKAYVGTMGGRVWRMDIDDADPGNWKLEKLADLGSSFKFFFRPDVVVTKNFDMVLIGSGDREKPAVSTSTDYFFMLEDPATGKDGSSIVPIGFSNLVAASQPLGTAKGWYLALLPGEKVVNAPLSIGGVTYFSTNQPVAVASTSCTANLGTARAYAVDVLTGGAGLDRNGDGTKNASDLSVTLTGGGLPPSPAGGVVQLDNGQLVDFIIGSGGSNNSAIEVGKPQVTIPKVRKKLYWNTNSDK